MRRLQLSSGPCRIRFGPTGQKRHGTLESSIALAAGSFPIHHGNDTRTPRSAPRGTEILQQRAVAGHIAGANVATTIQIDAQVVGSAGIDARRVVAAKQNLGASSGDGIITFVTGQTSASTSAPALTKVEIGIGTARGEGLFQ